MIATRHRIGMLPLTIVIASSLPMMIGYGGEPSPRTILPEWELKDSGIKTSIRGIGAVDGEVCWLGTKGGVSRTTDGGATWQVFKVGHADLDFRDIEAFDAQHCIAMSAGTGDTSRIYRTKDGGETWKLVHQNSHEKGFFNGMAFSDEKRGILAGDPIGGRLFLLSTKDGGESWQRLAEKTAPKMEDGEHAFAASGTHLAVGGDGSSIFVSSGGKVSRLFRSQDWGESWSVVAVPMISGKPSTGIFSVAFHEKNGFSVGGDYEKESEGRDNAMLTADGGEHWAKITRGGKAPFDFRSCVAYLDANTLVAVGPSGSDISHDGGRTWTPLAAEAGFHTLSIPGGVAWAAGADGRVGRLRIR